jgi:8-oxo-dGTP pyrophosphatase MutT (NUDIX family)
MIATLLFTVKGKRILLAYKKRGFGEGLWNGVGGKPEKGETIEQTAVRETVEEIGITPTKFEKAGILEFDEYIKGEPGHLVGHVFLCTEFTGTPTESDEMRPRWFDIDKIPYDKMFKDDRYWLPEILAGRKVRAYFKYDKDWNMLEHSIAVADDI